MTKRNKKSLPKILFPNEHGAWAMLFTAFLLGWLAAPEVSWRPLYLFPAAVGAFLTRYPLSLYFKKRRVARTRKISLNQEKKWFLIYALLTLIVFIPLLWPLQWWWLFIFGGLSSIAFMIHLRSIKRREERKLIVEITAMIGISFLVPAASYASLLHWDWTILIVWGFFILFFTQRIVTIRSQLRSDKVQRSDIKKVGIRELAYSAVFLVVVIRIARMLYHYL